MVWQLLIKRKISLVFKHLLKRHDIIFLLIGLIVSVATLTTTLMLFEGYEKALKDAILNFNAHVYFFHPGSNDLLPENVKEIDKYLSSKPEVDSYQSVVMGQGLISAKGSLKGVNYRTVNYKQKKIPILYKDIIVEGDYKLLKYEDVVIGKNLGKKLNLAIGDTVYFLSTKSKAFSVNQMQQSMLIIRGFFSTGMYDYDTKTIFINTHLASDIFGKSNQYSLVEVKLKPEYIEKARDFAVKSERDLGLKYQVYSWIHYNGNIFTLLRLEKWVIGIVLFFLIIIASFSVVTSTITTISEEKKKIAILKTLGLKMSSIYSIYFLKTFFTGLLAVILGIISAFGISYLITKQRFLHMYGEVYLLDAFHVNISLTTLTIVVVGSMLVVSLSTVLALKRLLELDIITVLRMRK